MEREGCDCRTTGHAKDGSETALFSGEGLLGGCLTPRRCSYVNRILRPILQSPWYEYIAKLNAGQRSMLVTPSLLKSGKRLGA